MLSICTIKIVLHEWLYEGWRLAVATFQLFNGTSQILICLYFILWLPAVLGVAGIIENIWVSMKGSAFRIDFFEYIIHTSTFDELCWLYFSNFSLKNCLDEKFVRTWVIYAMEWNKMIKMPQFFSETSVFIGFFHSLFNLSSKRFFHWCWMRTRFFFFFSLGYFHWNQLH